MSMANKEQNKEVGIVSFDAMIKSLAKSLLILETNLTKVSERSSRRTVGLVQIVWGRLDQKNKE